MHKYGQELPAEVEQNLDAYIERIKSIRWFNHDKLDKETTEKQVNVVLEAFGVKASVEYRSIKTESDWGAARGAARDAAWNAAWDAARDAARDAAWDAAWEAARDAAWNAAWDAARDAARDAAWGAAEVLAKDLKGFSDKYPNGAFLQLIPLWEMGLYPCGVVDGKFVIYVPHEKEETAHSADEPQSIHDMKLHDLFRGKPNGDYTVLRVPGGWIYTIYHGGYDTANNIFVPYNEEFKPEVTPKV